MYIPELERHLAICGVRDLQGILRRDPRFWHVVSIHDPTEPAPVILGARQVHRCAFFDVEDPTWAADVGAKAPHAQDVADIFRFVQAREKEPILIHCRAGVSRSTALALGLILAAYHAAGRLNDAELAVDQLLLIRPRAVPNTLVLRLALQQFLQPDEAAALLNRISRHAALLENRKLNPERR